MCHPEKRFAGSGLKSSSSFQVCQERRKHTQRALHDCLEERCDEKDYEYIGDKCLYTNMKDYETCMSECRTPAGTQPKTRWACYRELGDEETDRDCHAAPGVTESS